MNAPASARPVAGKEPLDLKRIALITLGLGLFALVNFAPQFPAAVDPTGQTFELSRQAQGAIAVFLLAGIWWVFEVIPIGVTRSAMRISIGFSFVPSRMIRSSG